MEEIINIVTTQLPDYVEQNRDEIIRKVVLGGRTIGHMVPQPGIKTKAAINYLDVDPQFQDGRGCKFTPQEGGIVLTQREIETGIIKVEFEICPDTLLGKYAEFLVKIKATEQEFPFERFIMEDTIAKIDAKLEKAIWQGDKDSDDGDLNKFDGLLKLAGEEDDTIEITYAENSSAWDRIKAAILALPDEALNAPGRTVVYVGTEIFRNFMLELVEKNFYHYDGAHDEAPMEFVFPGTNTLVIATPGLSRTNVVYATYERNMYYGFDMLDAKEEAKVIWDEKNGVFAVKVKWNSGVQTAFPDMVVLGAIAQPEPTPDPDPVTISGAASLSLANTSGSNERTYATSDGSAVEAEVTTDGADWLTVNVGENGHTVTFTRTAQAAGAAERTATVHLSTETGGSKDVTVTQAAGESL